MCLRPALVVGIWRHARGGRNARLHAAQRPPSVALSHVRMNGLSSHVWRQDHNGFSHQDPGFIDHVVNKKTEVVRVYLPPDAISGRSLAKWKDGLDERFDLGCQK
jgi:D-xylulose 5-phosphate/D-fructose 6-phosphate phosphoketolase